MSENPRGADPRDKRDYVPPYTPEPIPDPLDLPVAHPNANVPDVRGADPHDRRDTRSPAVDAMDDAFQLPQYALDGQEVTSTFGKKYRFNAATGQWVDGGPAPTATTYTFRIGIDETSPGIVDVMPATANGEIGGINEPAANGLFLRSAAGAVYTWAPAAPGTAYIWGVGLTEAPPGTINLDPASSTVIGGMTEPAADGQYVRSAVGTTYSWVPVAAGGLTFDTGLTLTGTSVNLDPALPPGGEIGGINEPPADDGKQYSRSYTAGAGIWTEITGGGYTFGIGLDEVPPGSFNVDLLPATPTVIGGVSVVARSLTQGLDLVASGALTAPLATDLLAGSIVEPLPDDKKYLRTRTVAGVSSWIEATTATLLWGIGIDESTTTPGTIDLQPANFTPGEIGGIVSEPRTLTQGILLDEATGLLTAPRATEALAGTIVEPLPNGIAHTRKWDLVGLGYIWEPALTAGLTITGVIPTAALIGAGEPDLTVHIIGQLFTATTEVLFDGVPVTKTFVSATEMTTLVTPSTETVRTVVVTVREGATPGAGAEGFSFIAAEDGLYQGRWSVAGNVPDINAMTKEAEWTWLAVTANPQVPEVAPALLPGIGGMTIAQGDHIVWNAGTAQFLRITGVTTIYGIGLDAETLPGTVHLQIANTAGEIGGITVVPQSATQGLVLDLATGALTAPLATDLLAGSIVEPLPNDLFYVRQRTAAAVSGWVDARSIYTWGIGIDETAPGVIDVIPATATVLGGVSVVARSNVQGLELDALGALTGPLATDLLAGSIVEPLPDDLRYVRMRSLAGVSSWVPESTTDYGTGLTKDDTATPPIVHLQPAGDSPATLGGVYVIDRVRNISEGLELGLDGRLRAPLATDLLAGSIVEPTPSDTVRYLRQRTLAGVSAWVDADVSVLGIELINPNVVQIGSAPQIIEVHGSKFTAATIVNLDGVATPTTYISPTELTFTVTPLAETVRTVVVTVSDGGAPGAGDAPLYYRSSDKLYQGTWQPVTNTPDILIPPKGDKWMWVVDTADSRIGELVPTTIPGIAGVEAREGDHVVWDATAATFSLIATRALIVTDVVPSQMIIGAPPTQIHIYGSGFTATTEVLWEGVAVPTTFLDANKLRITVDQATMMPPTRSFVVVAVQDGVARPGNGAAGFQFVEAGASVFVGDDPPAAPHTQGRQWFESDTGRMFVWFIDATAGGQWVQTGGR